MEKAQRILVSRWLGTPWFVPNYMLQRADGVRKIVEVVEESRTNRVE